MRKLSKKLLLSILSVALVFIALGTTTFAWFTMNTQVSTGQMQVKAVAEDGILIINELDADTSANWKKTTSASYGSLATLAPTSTADLATWFHNSSDDQNDAKAGQAASTYETLSGTGWKRDQGENKSGVYYVDLNNNNALDENEKAYTLLNKFFIKSSGDAITLGTGNTYLDLYVNKITASGASSTAALDASLRVGVKVGDTIVIYAPVTGATTSYKAGGNDTGTAVTATAVPTNGVVNTALSVASIPAITAAKASTIEVNVFIYFEGEDAGLKSANLLATLDTLQVEVEFGITQLSTN